MKNKIIFFCAMFLLMFTSVTFAYNPYPMHLGGDNNFILCDGHMGTAWYVDRSSLMVQKYEPPQYIIAVNVVSVEQADAGNTAISNVRTYRFFYNYDLRNMYVDTNGNSDWRHLEPQGCWAATGIRMPAGEIAFALAYKLKFYGGRSWYNQFLNRSTVVFDDDFYNRL